MTVYLCKKINGAKFIDNCIIENKIYNKKLYKKSSLDKMSSHYKTIGILNLMPNKVETEIHLLELFSKMNEDINKKLSIDIPKNYFIEGDTNKGISAE